MVKAKAPKVTTAAKRPVKMRFKKLADGSMSIYLDTYLNGKRSYEFLAVPHLVPEHNKEDRERNQATLRLADEILKRRNDEADRVKGLKVFDAKTPLLVWMDECKTEAVKTAEAKGRDKTNNAATYANAIKHLRIFINDHYGEGKADTYKLARVDEDFCKGFIDYLNTKAVAARVGEQHQTPRQLSPNTRNTYFTRLAAALNKAVLDGLIAAAPTKNFTRKHGNRPQQQASKREYLTESELKTLIGTDCKCKEIREAFLFSCMCGLRWSDINALRWQDIHTNGNVWQIETRMVKTQELLYLPLSEQAKAFIPERADKEPSDRVFTLPSLFKAERVLKKWVESAKINKHITFHCGRHTFATLVITKGADVYTTRDLLGHTSVKTTEIYAEIVDAKKAEAVNLLNGIF